MKNGHSNKYTRDLKKKVKIQNIKYVFTNNTPKYCYFFKCLSNKNITLIKTIILKVPSR